MTNRRRIAELTRQLEQQAAETTRLANTIAQLATAQATTNQALIDGLNSLNARLCFAVQINGPTPTI